MEAEGMVEEEGDMVDGVEEVVIMEDMAVREEEVITEVMAVMAQLLTR